MVVYDFLQPTPLTEGGEEFQAFIAPFEGLRGIPVQEAASVLRSAIYATFRYEGEVTNVSSPVTELLRHGGGVCQDFAHLMLTACRHLGFPARYVSGYVLMEEGEATASHAWAEVFDPDQGWFGQDPTHNAETGERYVRPRRRPRLPRRAPQPRHFRGSSEEEVQVRVRLRPQLTWPNSKPRPRLYPEPRAATPRSRRSRQTRPRLHPGTDRHPAAAAVRPWRWAETLAVTGPAYPVGIASGSAVANRTLSCSFSSIRFCSRRRAPRSTRTS